MSDLAAAGMVLQKLLEPKFCNLGLVKKFEHGRAPSKRPNPTEWRLIRPNGVARHVADVVAGAAGPVRKFLLLGQLYSLEEPGLKYGLELEIENLSSHKPRHEKRF